MFALGYVQAQDRMFQMEMAKRLTQGRLSEVLGPDSIGDDRFNLNMMKRYWTEKTLEMMEQSTDPFDILVLNYLCSFADGINYYLDSNPKLPLEFMFLGFTPEHWSPLDTLSFIKYMSDMLTWSYADFKNILIYETLGEDNYTELFGLPMPYQIPITPDYGVYEDIKSYESNTDEKITSSDTVSTDLLKSIYGLLDDIKQIPNELERMENYNLKGSNNWVVSGDKTATGKPILCNDMHLTFNLPGIWYEAHLINQKPGEEWSTYGFFLTGVPYPIVGHNNYVGWGMTNTGYDVIDWYYYDAVNETHYWYKGEESAYDIIEYQINIKDENPEVYQVKQTVHGPVFPYVTDSTTLQDKVFACKWIGQSITEEGKAIYLFNHAKNREEFNEASAIFSTPAQNLVYGDVHGNIGIRPTGKVPIRNDTLIPDWHTGNGTMPYDGSAGEGEWIGYVPFEDLPHGENPTQGYLASANQIVAGPDYLKEHQLQELLYVASGYRARRINDILRESNDITIEDMKELQLDIYSIEAGNFTPYLLNVLGNLSSRTYFEQQGFNILSSWDYQMEKESTAATIYSAWIQRLRWQTFGDDVTGKGAPSYPKYTVLEELVKTSPNSKWFDNITTSEIENRNEIILLSFRETMDALSEFYNNDDPSTWEWGELHQLLIRHLTGLGALGYGPVPIDGTSNTVMPYSTNGLWRDNEIRRSLGTHGASERMIIDFSNLNNTLSIIPSGQRGVSNSEHYTDQLEMYLNGEYHTQYFGADTISKFKAIWIESSIYFKSGGN